MSTPAALQGEHVTAIVPKWTFGDRLRKIRRDVAGLTQADFAESIGTPKERYANWEFGRGYPRNLLAIAKRIEMAYNVPSAWTLGMDDGRDGDPEAETPGIRQRVLIDAVRGGLIDETTLASLLAKALTVSDGDEAEAYGPSPAARALRRERAFSHSSWQSVSPLWPFSGASSPGGPMRALRLLSLGRTHQAGHTRSGERLGSAA